MAGDGKSKAYVYRAPNGSWLYEKVLSPYVYNAIVKIFPMWLHPNALTLCGFICASTSLVINSLFLPKFEDTDANVKNVAHWSFYVLIAIFHALYTIFDNTDGKQARRTKTSSAAGEIFDHGVDQSVSSIAMIITSACLKLTYTQAAGMLLFGHTCTFMNNWYHKVTGVMSWGGRYLSVDEACLATIGIAVGAGLYGPKIYHSVILADMPNPLFFISLSEESDLDISFGNTLCATSIAYGIYDTFVKLWLSFSIAADKGEVWNAFYSLLPFAYFMFFAGINFCVGTTEEDARLPQLVLTGTVYSIVGLRLIISMSIAQNTLFFMQHNLACAMGLVVLMLQALERLDVLQGMALSSTDTVTKMMCLMLAIHFTTFAYALTTYNGGKPLFVMQKKHTS
eukprot:m.10322 g.10322  ORF g.10322 m.10322 type:complete len:396 (-) comp7321_c0_seq1:281-1468(-)